LIYQFNQITLDTSQYRLSLSGNPVAVEPQVFDLLTYLVEHKDRVVTRDELLENLWKGKIVTDSALGARLKAARKAVGDSGKRQQVIKTIHGRGYQFVSPVTEVHSETVKAEQTDSEINKTNLVLTDTPSIAVLPFQNMSADPEQEYFANGMSEEIITALSRVPDLVVIARKSTFFYKGKAVNVRQIGQELGVRHVLEGSIRKSGNRIRITAQLVNTQSGDHIWAERYDRNLDDIFAVQDEITHEIVVELQGKLIMGENSRLAASGTNSIKAWELVTRATPLIETLLRNDAMHAKKLLGQALELDNNYSAAWTMLGWMYWQESVWKWCSDTEKSMQLAFEAAQNAISADADYPHAYGLLGSIYMVHGDQSKAVSMCEKAVALAPSDALALAILADVLVDSGRLKEGVQKMKKAIRLSPFPPVWFLMVLGVGYHLSGENEIAISALKQAAKGMPDSNLPLMWLASTLVEMGRLDEARVASKTALEIEPSFDVVSWAKGYKADSHIRLKDNLLAAGFPE